MSEEQGLRKPPSDAVEEQAGRGSDGTSGQDRDTFASATAAVLRVGRFDPKLRDVSELELLEAATALTRER